MASLLDTLVGGYASLFCLNERRGSPQMSAKVHAPLERRSAPLQKKPTKLSINDRLRALIGDIISEEELEQRLSFGRVLGAGATSKVYEAVEMSSGQRVSVKVFDKVSMVEARRSMVADGQYVREKAVHRVRRRLLKLVSELEISKSLDHLNIIKYLGAYETSHRICIVHELVEGSDLLEHLLENGKMPEDQAAGVFRQLLSALEYCHNRNIFHRDLKLENVMVTKDLKVKLIDFGLSEVVANPEQPLKTVCGTPLYCSPEILFLHATAQAAREGFRGGPADVWSVGVLIFALLTGCAPFDDSDFHRLRLDVSRNRINYPAYISDQAKGLLKNVLVTDPLMRPTATDLLSYGWFQDSPESESLSDNQEEDWLCTKRKTELNDDIRCRSLSCRRTTESDGTYSSSASLEDVSKRKLSSPTHFSSLEKEAVEGTTF
ncbi:CAMK/CAMKL protein kinase [Phytophthora nicotianae P10297]|uniref:CAMK/CAMKL protein kinase n=1 Tax=Phytophthora nicotianae P10297 TaxID=1317064 RepID=W2YV53_PHYNI|nr:CAMK/CAMKL protein kinase [Phytophthora nicotianae P10297]